MILKQSPEDFIVREHANLDLAPGPHSVYLLRKRTWNTEDCLQWLVEKKGVPRKHIGVCGNKDKQAITEQFITIKSGPATISTPGDWTLTYLGTKREALHMGDHDRNFFVITVRGLNEKFQPPQSTVVRNLYGEQRFGKDNVSVGLCLLRKKYAEACALLNLPADSNPIGALRKIPRHNLLLYVHSVQSLLWNELVVSLPLQPRDVPIIGFGPSGDQSLLPLYNPIMQKHDLPEDCWINRSIPELSVEGGSRPLVQDMRDLSISNVEDGACTVCFSLGKGSYATQTVEQLFSAKITTQNQLSEDN